MPAPIHIMRWAPADYLMDGFVVGCYLRRDYKTLAFYSAFLFRSHLEGGSLPAEPRQLVGFVAMPMRDLVPAMQVCLDAGKLVVENGRIFHPRVAEDVANAKAFRDSQANLGRRGGAIAGKGRPKKRIGVALSENRGMPMDAIGQPLPKPKPMPEPYGEDKKLSPQQAIVKQVLEVYGGLEITPPQPGQINRWAKLIGGHEPLLVLINELADTGKLGKGEGYIAACIKGRASEHGEEKLSEQSPFDPKLDGIHKPNLLRHSSYYGRAIPEQEWKSRAILESEQGPFKGEHV